MGMWVKIRTANGIYHSFPVRIGTTAMIKANHYEIVRLYRKA